MNEVNDQCSEALKNKLIKFTLSIAYITNNAPVSNPSMAEHHGTGCSDLHRQTCGDIAHRICNSNFCEFFKDY